jgi:predicted RNase H-like HicB family nuclease
MLFPVGVRVGNAGRNFGVVVPDIPECVCVGATLDAALASARAAIERYVTSLADRGVAVTRAGRGVESPVDDSVCLWLTLLIDVEDIHDRLARQLRNA